MFHDVAYITRDYTLRAQDGCLIFRWWKRYVPKDVSEDLSYSDTRVSVELNGFECHVYNRTSVYRDLERKFGLEPKLSQACSNGRKDPRSEVDPERERINIEEDEATDEVAESGSTSYILGKNWRDLIPVIKIDVKYGKVAFGNKLLPTTLVISSEDAHLTYSTKPAGCSLDHFMHFVKARMENFKILLAPSPKYTGMRDEAPRFMGEGFVILSSNQINAYYYMDEPGLVPEQSESRSTTFPVPDWGVDIKCGKGTNFSYGPWADRQRELIYKFYFPADYLPMKVTPAPKAGTPREARYFRIRASTEFESALDVLFTKLKETNAVHVNIGQGTNFEIKIPWFVSDEGYTSTVNGTLMLVDATTSLQYRELLKAETLELRIKMHYPIHWNSYQEWLFDVIGTKVSLNFIFAHKWFFQVIKDICVILGYGNIYFYSVSIISINIYHQQRRRISFRQQIHEFRHSCNEYTISGFTR